MRSGRIPVAALLAGTLVLMTARFGNAASLQQVSNWGVSGLPADVSMYIYVPDRVATNPPILTLIHYCGGTAAAVFGQARTGGVVGAADQYGFIMVVPSSGRCWDVQSNKTWTRDGGGDSHAIRQMVRYASSQYKGNADRVYATGDSSGGMMTELLLALYPDVFTAGSAFAGMPAACRGASESGSGGGYSGACAGGSVTHTPQEWGDIVRKMNPGYTGHRPRVQLFHGDADTTIRYANFTEAIKEWTNVLGLATAPTATTMNVPLGDHQATRQQWRNSCGYLVLEGFTSLGGDHGPSDALFKAEYVVPFLSLDKTGTIDPEIQQCSGGGTGGTSGVDAGADGAGRGGVGGANGGGGGSGSAGVGGSAGRGGSGGTATGGTSGGGGGGASGGGGGATAGTGAGTGAGGSSGASGAGGSSGASGAQGQGGRGGATGGSGGAAGTGGVADGGRGGGAGSGAGGTANNDGAAGSRAGGADSAGCSCGLAATSTDHSEILSLAVGLALVIFAGTRRGCRRRIRHARRIC